MNNIATNFDDELCTIYDFSDELSLNEINKTVLSTKFGSYIKDNDHNLLGYKHPRYAKSFSHLGTPLYLPNSGGSLIKCNIPNTDYYDAMGAYPIFSCKDWRGLKKDISTLQDELVSISLVTDPFGNYDKDILEDCFSHKVVNFKDHFIIDLSQSMDDYISKHHKRNVKHGMKELEIKLCMGPAILLEYWAKLYRNLVNKHNISSIANFPHDSLLNQLEVPGMIILRALHNSETVGMILWYIQDKIAYYHLGAYSQEGYMQKASFALFWASIKFFTDMNFNWISLGAGAGINKNEDDGLSRFKRGWSTDQRSVFFCGQILNNKRYEEITSRTETAVPDFFPAYRYGDFF